MLEDLPLELLHRVMLLSASPRTLGRLARTSQRLRAAVAETADWVWQALVMHRWGWLLVLSAGTLARSGWFQVGGGTWLGLHRYLSVVAVGGGGRPDGDGDGDAVPAAMLVVVKGTDGVSPAAVVGLTLDKPPQHSRRAAETSDSCLSAIEDLADVVPSAAAAPTGDAAAAFHAEGAAECAEAAAARAEFRRDLRNHQITHRILLPPWVDDSKLDLSPARLDGVARRSQTTIVAWGASEHRTWGAHVAITGSNFDDGIDIAAGHLEDLFAATWPWKLLPTAPKVGRHMASTLRDPLSGGLIVIGGVVHTVKMGSLHQDPTDSVEFYCVQKRTWSPWAALSTMRSCSAATVDSRGDVYVCGGSESMYTQADVFSSCERYSRAAEAWVAVAPMLEQRCAFGAALTRDSTSIVACGGYGGAGAYLASAEGLDLATGTWSPLPPLSVERAGCQVHRGPDGRVWAVGGGGDGRTCCKTVEAYDSRCSVWDRTIPSLVEPRHYMGCGWGPDAMLYVVGGFHPLEHLRTCERFDLRAGKWEQLPPLPARSEDVRFPSAAVLF
eukprot:m.87308 g.87308  ORF g.87308 m.87308 type:complete len:555 (-) comp19923_c0_seq2:2772-4436(-)